MVSLSETFEPDRRPDGAVALHFTPAEWRFLLEDPSFLSHDDNRYLAPRRFMGVPVAIVPDHRWG